MRSQLLAMALMLFSGVSVLAQVDGIRTATGQPFSMDARMVFGRVSLEGLEAGAKLPTVYVVLFDRRMQMHRTTLDREGYFYFRDLVADGGTVIVELNGTEVGRQTLLTFGSKQQRVDFNLTVPQRSGTAPPGTVSVKYHHDRTKENLALLNKATAAIEDKKPEKAVPYLKKLLKSDDADYPAWTILGAAHLALGQQQEAESAFVKALSIRPDSVPTMTSLGRLYLLQKNYERAIELLSNATVAEPTSAVSFRLLGEAYLYARKGSNGVAALTEALRLQPVEMAECHLLLARLYDIAGARHMASSEFKAFLEKVPGHPDKDKMLDYIKEHPVQ